MEDCFKIGDTGLLGAGGSNFSANPTQVTGKSGSLIETR